MSLISPVLRPIFHALIGSVAAGGASTRGPELVTNGDFPSSIAGWTALNANAAASWDAGRLKVVTAAATTGVYQRITVVPGRRYEMKIDGACEAGSFSTRATDGAVPSASILAETATLTAGQSALQVVQFTALSVDMCVYIRTAVASTYRGDNISLRLITG